MNDINKNLVTRVTSVAVLLPGIVFLLVRGSYWSGALIGVASVACVWEYYRMVGLPFKGAALLGLCGALAMPLLAVWHPGRAFNDCFWVVTAVFLAAWIDQLLRGPLDHAPVAASQLTTGLLYGGIGLTALSAIRQDLDGLKWVYCTLIVTWGNDTLAYFSGRLLGRHKIYPSVSPNKTWEGFAGGWLGSLAGMFVARATFFKGLSLMDCFWIGGICGVVGPLGDLCESMLKRAYQMKDSSQLIPGHGGVLDRIDALLFNAPIVLAYLQFVR